MRQLLIPVGRSLTADDSIYGVRVVADECDDGRWHASIEFQSRSGIRLEAPFGQHDSAAELCDWTAHLDDSALRRALSRASLGVIERGESQER